jgi:hypothetical protein
MSGERRWHAQPRQAAAIVALRSMRWA